MVTAFKKSGNRVNPKQIKKYFCNSNDTTYKKGQRQLERHSKGQFCKNTVYLERGMPYFAFVSTNAVLVSKIDKV